MNQIASRFGLAFAVVWISAAGCSSKSESSGNLDGGGTSTTTGSGTGSGSTGSGSTTSSTTTGTGGGDVCAQSCTKIEAAHCVGDTPGECATFCQAPVCIMQRTALGTCILGATVSCNPDTGEATAPACDALADAYTECLTNQ